MDDRDRALRAAADLAHEFLASLPERHVGATADASAIAAALGGALPDEGSDPEAVVRELAAAVAPGIVASAGPRYYGFVVGGALPASAAADWLTTAWAQNGALHALSPAAAAAEEVAGAWMLELLGLPATASVGFPTGAGLGNAVGLGAARHAVLERAGWDVEARGLYGAPEIRVLIGDEAHSTVLTALQYLGLGRERVIRVPVDGQGRMRADALAAILDRQPDPTIVVAQSGNVNTGAFDPLAPIADLVEGQPNAWLHVDGAFGLWAHVSPRLRPLVEGVERADSWATDAHKWLNVGYDCGFVAVTDRQAHRSAMAVSAPYLMMTAGERHGSEYVLDSSRRARGFIVWAAIRSLGRDGIRDMVERCCDLAARIAGRLAADPRVEILNDVVLNQVLVAFHPASERDPAEGDALTRTVVARVQEDGTAWMGSTVWHGRTAMRISVSNWSTTEADADRTVDAILAAIGRQP